MTELEILQEQVKELEARVRDLEQVQRTYWPIVTREQDEPGNPRFPGDPVFWDLH